MSRLSYVFVIFGMLRVLDGPFKEGKVKIRIFKRPILQEGGIHTKHKNESKIRSIFKWKMSTQM